MLTDNNEGILIFIQIRFVKCLPIGSSCLMFTGTWTEGQTDAGTNVTRNSFDSLVS